MLQKIIRNKFASLTALSPLDGRYKKSIKSLQGYFSQMALMKYRVRVQSQWVIHLLKNNIIKTQKNCSIEQFQKCLQKLWIKFTIKDGTRIKQIQSITNHDLKSVEYFIKQNISNYQQYVHFCCTSQDINNLSYALMLTQGLNNAIYPTLEDISKKIIQKSQQWAKHPMMARTHGQPATPTTLGKQYANYAYRLNKQFKNIKTIKMTGKMNGAVGNYNAHYFAYPQYNWQQICKQFIQNTLKLQFNPYTTQIQSHDTLARIFGQISLYNTILIGLCKDSWEYVSKNYLKQKTLEGQIGSSTMPHKVNPIDFQNCQGNLGIANSLIYHFKQKLPISRQQRDLSDSTVLRNQGSALGYCLVAYNSLLKGLNKIDSNEQLMLQQLKNHYQVITQAIQTQLRKIGYPQPYQLLKKLSRGRTFNQISKQQLIKQLEGKINPQSIQKIKLLKPQNYLGIAQNLALKVSNKKN